MATKTPSEPGTRPRARTRGGVVLVVAALLAWLALVGATPQDPMADLDAELSRLAAGQPGLRLGVAVWLDGRGLVYAREADSLRSAASAIKSAVALDLLATHRGRMDRVPEGVGKLLRPGAHLAFRGFSAQALAHAAQDLEGKTYLGLARIMMGQDPADHDVYNAACNVLLVKLGGPDSVRARVQAMDPAFHGLDLNRYMETWIGDGDNRATPAALLALYCLAATRKLPGLDPRGQELFQTLLQEEGGDGVFEKAGTLYPKPMVRVHAGYVERKGGDLVYVVMGEIPAPVPGADRGELVMRLVTTVDAVTMVCREIPDYLPR